MKIPLNPPLIKGELLVAQPLSKGELLVAGSHPPDRDFMIPMALPALEDPFFPGFTRRAVEDHQMAVGCPAPIHIFRRLPEAVR